MPRSRSIPEPLTAASNQTKRQPKMINAEKEDPYAARRFSTPHYECELPRNVRFELLSLRRASKSPGERRRQRALSPPRKRKPGFGFYARLLVLLAVGLGLFWAGQSRRAPRVSSPLPVSRSGALQPVVRARVSPTPAPLPVAGRESALEEASASAPFSLGSGGWRGERPTADATAGRIPEAAPRARRVFTVRRPAVVRMPDGALVHTTFRGIKDTFAQLPGDPQWGDAWEILEGVPNLWVWYCLRGHSAPAWVDP
jgi:hypothetical protein